MGNLRIKSMTLPKNFSRESHHCTRVHQFKLVHGYLRINARLISSERTVKYVLIPVWALTTSKNALIRRYGISNLQFSDSKGLVHWYAPLEFVTSAEI